LLCNVHLHFKTDCAVLLTGWQSLFLPHFNWCKAGVDGGVIGNTPLDSLWQF
jgi:hypothetical protein